MHTPIPREDQYSVQYSNCKYPSDANQKGRSFETQMSSIAVNSILNPWVRFVPLFLLLSQLPSGKSKPPNALINCAPHADAIASNALFDSLRISTEQLLRIPRMAAPHVLVVPIDAAGHINPLLRLATEIAGRGVKVTFAQWEDVVGGLKAGDKVAGLKGLDFEFVGLKRIEGGKKVMGPDAFGLRDSFDPYMEKLVEKRSKGVAGPTCVLSDMFLNWTQDVADELQIPRYMFVPSGVNFARLMDGVVDQFNSGKLQISETDGKMVKFDDPICIPGLPPLIYHEIPPSLRNDPAGFLERCETVAKAAGVLVNSILELEHVIIKAWQNEGASQHKQIPKIFPVGPLFSVSLSAVDPNPENPSMKCLNWLSSQPTSSVLYVAFGSHANLPAQKITEVAHGLEDSQQRFLWVLPQHAGSLVSELLPPGFLDRVGDRGYIMTDWAPQLQILAHESTGGFLTHAGWNSAIESIIFGVPMISWPQQAEQHLNCRTLVDDMKIAVQLQTGPQNIVSKTEVERVVRLLMVEPEGKVIKERAEQFKRKCASAMAEGGSSSKFLEEFLDDIRHPLKLELK